MIMTDSADMEDLKLPVEFLMRMQAECGEEYDAFMHSLNQERCRGLRLNPLKLDLNDAGEALKRLGMEELADDPVPWCTEGYYYDKDSCPGRSPFHEAGAYYIQEPSAMMTGEMLDPRPGEVICDLCAAPGGKTTHVAGKMQGKGVLVSNEIVPDRARILSGNVERMGIANCIVTSASPDQMAKALPSFFDKVCVDAPCSGEGMFRKNPEAVAEWSPWAVDHCAARQREILESAADLVRMGGVLVYSTCTFEKSENEEMISSFINDHPEWVLEDEHRLMPHKCRGEGHFVACMTKGVRTPSAGVAAGEDLTGKKDRLRTEVLRFLHTEAGLIEGSGMDDRIMKGILINRNDHAYCLPPGISPHNLDGLKVIRPGLELAGIERGRYKPAHALAMTMNEDDLHICCNLSLDQAYAYLRGETISMSDVDPDHGSMHENGWSLVTVNGISMGWGKISNGILKNHYPKGLRRDLER